MTKKPKTLMGINREKASTAIRYGKRWFEVEPKDVVPAIPLADVEKAIDKVEDNKCGFSKLFVRKLRKELGTQKKEGK